MRKGLVIILAASGGAAVAIIGMKVAPYSSTIVNVLHPPTATPTPTETATPTDTPVPTPTETPDPNPLKSSCAVFRLAGARLLDAYDEKIHVDSDDLGQQYGLARNIVLLAAAAQDRHCGDEWTNLRRRFSFVGDQIEKQFDNLQELYLLQNNFDRHAMVITNINRCIFYGSAHAVVLELFLAAGCEAPGVASPPDCKLISTVCEELDRRSWEPMRRQLHCAGTENEGKKKQAPRKRK